MAALTGIKRGNTLTISGTYTTSLSGITITCDMVRGSVRQALVPETIDAAAGTFRLTLDKATTAGLALGTWKSDVRFTNTADGTAISTETFRIEIEEGVTDDAG